MISAPEIECLILKDLQHSIRAVVCQEKTTNETNIASLLTSTRCRLFRSRGPSLVGETNRVTFHVVNQKSK